MCQLFFSAQLTAWCRRPGKTKLCPKFGPKLLHRLRKKTFRTETRYDLRMGWDASACFITGSLARGSADQGVHSTCRLRGIF